jgi:hypothetical protein
MSYNPEEHSGAGTESIPNAKSMPMIGIIQSGSAQFKKSHKNYADKKIEGCEEGDIFFSSDNCLVNNPLTIIPLKCQETFTQWSEDNKLEAIYGVDIATESCFTTKKDGKKKLTFVNGKKVVKTDYWFIRFFHDDAWKEGIIALKVTGLKISTRIGNTIKRAQEHPLYAGKTYEPPTFSIRMEISTKAEAGHGNSWYEWDIVSDDVLDFTDAAEGDLMSECATIQSQVKMLEASQKAIEGGSEPDSSDGNQSEDPY